jgi:hypothetical protein
MPKAIKQIEWKQNVDDELKAAAGTDHPVLLDFSAAPM